MEENNIKVEGDHAKKTKIHPFHQKTPYKKFTLTKVGLEHAVLDFGTTKNVEKFTKFRDNISNNVAVYFKYGGPEEAKLLKETNAPIYKQQEDPDKDASYVEQHMWKSKYDSYQKGSKKWKENNGSYETMHLNIKE